MSRFYQPLPFSPAYDFVAAKPVTLNGKSLNPGDPIDKDGLHDRRLRQLYEARIITPVAPAELPASQSGLVDTPQEPQDGPQEPAEAQDAPDTPAEAQEPASEAQEPAGEPAPNASGARIEHRGFGRWFAIAADGTEQGPMGKAEAEALIAGA